jgi:hypothetical protein
MITYKGHQFAITVKEGFAYIFVDRKFAFRVKHPQTMAPQEYAKEFIDRRFRGAQEGK